jgi:hypothetical protein
VDGGSDSEVRLHALTPKIEVAVLEADVLVDVVGSRVDRERRRLGRPQHFDPALPDLDVTGGQVVVGGAVGTSPHDTGDAYDVFAADVDTVVDHALNDATVIADVDEGQFVAVFTSLGHPSAE